MSLGHRIVQFMLPADRRGPCEECKAPGRVLVVLVVPRPAAPVPRSDGRSTYPEEALGDRVACALLACRQAASRHLLARTEGSPPCSSS